MQAGAMRPNYREEPCKSALNRVAGGMHFAWSLNPYTGCVHRCTFCYVRAFERRADRPSGDAYGASIRVKTNFVQVLRAELARRSWKREHVAIGAATDPYQPVEGTYRLTRGSIEALGAARTPFSIITRGPLVVRDIDVLQSAAARAPVGVSFSIPTLDDDVWRTTEPGTAPPRQRLRALEKLVKAGVRAGVSIAPVIPGLSDAEDQIERVVRAARDAGAVSVWCNVLHLKPGTREHFLDHLARDWPELTPGIQSLYAAAYAPKDYQGSVQAMAAALTTRYGIADRRSRPIEPVPGPVQLGLFEAVIR
jgi:DNA repair photolyase